MSEDALDVVDARLTLLHEVRVEVVCFVPQETLCRVDGQIGRLDVLLQLRDFFGHVGKVCSITDALDDRVEAGEEC